MKQLFAFFLLLSLISSNANSQSMVWNQVAHPDSFQVNGVGFSSDGSRVLSGTNCHPAVARLYNELNGAITWNHVFDSAMYCSMGVGISSNGKYLGVIEEMGNVVIFDYSKVNPDSVMTINLATSNAFALSFAPNSAKMAAGCSGGRLKTYSLPSGTKHLDFIAHSGFVTTVDYSPDNKWIATGSTDDKAKVYDTLGVIKWTLTGHTGDVTSAKFSKDNLKLYTASKDNTVKVWDMSNGALLQTINVSADDVNSLDVAPANNALVTVSADDSVRIWSTSSYAKLAAFAKPVLGIPLCVAWSPTGKLIVTGTSTGKVVAYDANSFSGVVTLPVEPEFMLYPNPCVDQLNMDLSIFDTRSLEVFDGLGKAVFKTRFSSKAGLFSLNTSKYPKGVYFVRITDTENRMMVKEFVRQ